MVSGQCGVIIEMCLHDKRLHAFHAKEYSPHNFTIKSLHLKNKKCDHTGKTLCRVKTLGCARAYVMLGRFVYILTKQMVKYNEPAK